MFTVYKMDCRANGKSYIGITNNLVNRLSVHWSNAKRTDKREGQTVLCRAIRKYGKEQFVISGIDYAETWDEICEKEKFYIKNLDTYVPKGMNMTRGGDGVFGFVMPADVIRGTSNVSKGEGSPNSKLTEKDVLQIRGKYKKGGISQTQLAEEYNVSQRNIGFILIGEAWAHISEGILLPEEIKERVSVSKRRNKSKLIEKDVIEIRKKYKENKISQYQLAKEYGITKSAIGFIINGRSWSHIREGILTPVEIKACHHRHRIGKKGYTAKLTENDIIEIRRRHGNGNVSQCQLAEEYNVVQTNIGQIIRRETWKYI